MLFTLNPSSGGWIFACRMPEVITKNSLKWWQLKSPDNRRRRILHLYLLQPQLIQQNPIKTSCSHWEEPSNLWVMMTLICMKSWPLQNAASGVSVHVHQHSAGGRLTPSGQAPTNASEQCGGKELLRQREISVSALEWMKWNSKKKSQQHTYVYAQCSCKRTASTECQSEVMTNEWRTVFWDTNYRSGPLIIIWICYIDDREILKAFSNLSQWISIQYCVFV